MATRPRRAATAPSYPIQIVTRRTGLSADVVRAWEKRYGVVTPTRSAGGRRLYSDADVERLRLLAQATLTGRTIGQVAALTTPALATLVGGATASTPRRPAQPPAGDAPSSFVARDLLDASTAAVGRFDGVALDLLLRRATVALSAEAFLDALVVPLLGHLEARVRDGALRPAHWHVAHAVLRRVLDHVVATAIAPLASPDLVVTTPSGHAQELPALVVAASAAAEGWRVTYVGPAVPADDIAEIVRRLGARAIALSLGAAPGDRVVPRELRRLRTLLPADVDLLVDGASADVHRAVLDEVGATVLDDLAALRTRLRALRDTPSEARVSER